MMKLYGDIVSGNCYKAYLLLNLLEAEFDWINVDILQGEANTNEFRKKNPNAKIPLLELDDGSFISESNAILNYLAHGTAFLPDDPFLKAKVLEWQFFEQYSHEPYIAVARFINKYQNLPDSRRAEYESKQPGGHKALSIMEKQLNESDYLVGNQYTIADISLYAYTHVAHEGGFDLSHYPAINAWMSRIASHPKHVGMALKYIHQDATSIIAAVKYWIEKTIIGYNFCPFAKREFDNQRIHFELVDDANPEEQLHSMVNEFKRLDNQRDIETTVIILPVGLESFFDYLDFLEIANDLLVEEGYEGTYQLASFHPDYCFGDSKQDDAANFTNRSPYPLLHILREESLELVLEKYPNPESIPERNIEIAREAGAEIFEDILAQSKNCPKDPRH